MKFLAMIILGIALTSTTLVFSQQQSQRRQCGCRDCKCTMQSHCGSHSDRGCHCQQGEGMSCCSNGSCNSR